MIAPSATLEINLLHYETRDGDVALRVTCDGEHTYHRGAHAISEFYTRASTMWENVATLIDLAKEAQK